MHAHGLDHLATGAPGGLAAEDRPLVTMQLQQRETDGVGGQRQLIERRVNEHPDDLHLALVHRRDLGGDVGFAPARRRSPEDYSDRPGAGAHRIGGVTLVGDPTELDFWCGGVHAHILGS